MKRIFVSLFVAAMPLLASAQDLIVKKDGTIVKATVTKVSETEIEYRNFGSTSERIYSLKAASILSINYEDGTVEKFSVQEQDVQAQGVKEKNVQEPRNRRAEPDPEANRAAIEAVNSSVVSYDNNKPDKKAYYAILQFAAAPQSVLVSDELSISAEMGCIYQYSSGKTVKKAFDSYYGFWQKRIMSYCLSYQWRPHAAIKFYVNNRTDHTIYLDLGNTFLSVGGQTIPYYVPGAQSMTTTSSNGASVNLGAVAGAMGIGGAVGTLASGINVGGGNSTSSNNIVYNQRVIAVAPFSKVSLDAQIIDSKDGPLFNYDYCPVTRYPNTIKQGEKICFSEDTSPLKVRFFLAYSSTEDCANLNCMEVDYYGQSILGFGDTHGFSGKYFNFSMGALAVLSVLVIPKQ